MIYKLVCAGVDTFKEIYQKDEEEVIIAIDGGYQTLKDNNINVDYYFGDHDSLNDNDIDSTVIKNYPTMKDDSDFDLAIKFLIDNLKISIIDKVYVYNATGGRLDHYFAILNSIIKFKDYQIYMVDDKNKIFVSDYAMTFKKNEYKYISFFSLDDNTILSLNGFKYNLDNYNLKRNNNLCLSNEIMDNSTLVTNNKVLVIMSNSL